MIEFLTGIADAIAAFVDFLASTVFDFLQLLLLIPQVVIFFNMLIGFLPAPLITFALLGITASVVLMIVGRN